MMRIALPKGRNLPTVLRAARAAGLALDGVEKEGRRLWQTFPEDDVEVLMLKDWDLPLYVEHGVADLGFVGSDVLDELDGSLLVPARLREGACRMSLIACRAELPPPGSAVRVASKYPDLARRVLETKPWSAEILRLSGSVELGPMLELADMALDIVQTGRTLEENQLVELETIFAVHPCLVVNRASYQRHRDRLNELFRTLEKEGLVL